jgi:tRNA(fMet)-specific endonuclease VapC
MAKNQVVLCDTNIFINLFNGQVKTKAALDKIGDENIALSIITYAEIIYGTKKTDLNAIKAFFDRLTLIDLDEKVSQIFKGIVLGYSYNHHIKIPDALIASTAIYLGVPLYTENKKDFDFIPEIKFHKPL